MLDIPEPRLEVTEHNAAQYCCPKCATKVSAALSPDVGQHVQYGERIKSAAVYLYAQQLVPAERGEILQYLCGGVLVHDLNTLASPLESSFCTSMAKLQNPYLSKI